MFNLIYRLKEKELGTGLMSINMAKTYPEIFQAIDENSENIPDKNKIWQIQNPFLYKKPFANRVYDHVFIREQFVDFFPGKKLTNGFSYLKNHRTKYNYFLPTIYQSNFSCSEYPAIGYYIRDCRIQSNNEFLKFIMNLPQGTNIVTMGTKELIQNKIPLNVNWYHTYDNCDFWNMCSHYFYYRCSDIEDPLPHTLLEAIQSKHRIISPKNKKRTFTDGIDDLLSCVDYDVEYKSDMRGMDSILTSNDVFQKIIKNLSQQDFKINYSVKIDSFKNWIQYIYEIF